MNTARLPKPSVRWEALVDHARWLFGEAATTGRLCPECGSTAHGRPWVRDGATTWWASVSHHGPLTLSAIAAEPVGVDVEDVDAGREWVGLEAMLKAQGTGFAVRDIDPTRFDVTDLDAPPGVVAALATYCDDYCDVYWGNSGKSGTSAECTQASKRSSTSATESHIA